MAARTLLPLGGLVLALAAGCTPMRGPFAPAYYPATPPAGFAPGKSDPAPTDNSPKPPAPAPPAAGAVAPIGAMANVTPAGGQPAAPALPPPASTLPPPVGLAPPAVPQPTTGPPPAPGVQAPPGTPGLAPLPLPDPHRRDTPTVGGAVLNLAPGELPLDRMVEMQRQADAVARENAVLAARVRELLALGKEKDASLAEAMREVEVAAAEAARAKGEAAAARLDTAAVRARLEQQEREEVELLRQVVAALERLLNPPSPARREP